MADMHHNERKKWFKNEALEAEHLHKGGRAKIEKDEAWQKQ